MHPASEGKLSDMLRDMPQCIGKVELDLEKLSARMAPDANPISNHHIWRPSPKTGTTLSMHCFAGGAAGN